MSTTRNTERPAAKSKTSPRLDTGARHAGDAIRASNAAGHCRHRLRNGEPDATLAAAHGPHPVRRCTLGHVHRRLLVPTVRRRDIQGDGDDSAVESLSPRRAAVHRRDAWRHLLPDGVAAVDHAGGPRDHMGHGSAFHARGMVDLRVRASRGIELERGDHGGRGLRAQWDRRIADESRATTESCSCRH